MRNLKKIIEDKILSTGFDVVGFSDTCVDKNTKENYFNFLKKNHHGDMKWLESHYEKKINPKKVWDEVQTIVMIGMNYCPKQNPLQYNNYQNTSNISVYAKNEDYHNVIKKKLLILQKWFENCLSIKSKIFVDTSPILEKYFAEKCGIGWQGKHTNLVSKDYGSWLFLSGIFLPLKLSFNSKSKENCGKCIKCIDICPTSAIISENKIDARKCISYLTIEYKGPFPMSLRKSIGNKIYGCDDCLAICPWNKFSNPTKNEDFIQTENDKSLNFFLLFDNIKFKNYFKNSPIKRIGYTSFIRNVLIACGNSKHQGLKKNIYAYLKNPDPIIRGASVWSLGQLLDKNDKKILKNTLKNTEKNKYVLYELNLL